MVAALCGASVTLTDGEKFPNCLENCHKTCAINGLKDVCVTPLTWGLFSKAVLDLPRFDVILGSDCFYDPKGNILHCHDRVQNNIHKILLKLECA